MRAEVGCHRARAVWLVVAACTWVWTTPASAADGPIACDIFCHPEASPRLDAQRGQGFETGVILWDELNRRGAAPPPPPPASNLGPAEPSAVRVGPVATPAVVLIGTGR
jgi:hypothetical protein